ncbi:hypothetical protein ACFFRR_003289 [Megaselia abdita]
MSEKTDPLKRIQDEINEVARREEEYRRKLRNVNGAKNQDHDDIRSETPLSLSSMNSRESLDDNHSDDSGIISSISPMSDSMISNTPSFVAEKDKYNRPKYYSSVSQLNISNTINNNLSTVIPSTPTPRIFKPINSGQKSIMQKFIASRGKLNLNANNNNNSSIILNNNNSNGAVQLSPKNGFNRATPAIDIIPALIPAVAERDDEGKPIRRGFVPVEVKIRKELHDLKSRENELKRFRKLTNSTPDLLDAIENEFQESEDDDEEQRDDEHCLGPQKFKQSKLDWDEERNYPLNGLRPALSLAQLCDIDPDDSVSPQSIIAKFERLIQDNA